MSVIWVLLLSSTIVLCVNAGVTVRIVEDGKGYTVPLVLFANNTRNINLVTGLSYKLGCVSDVGFDNPPWTNASGTVVTSDTGTAVYQLNDNIILFGWYLVLTSFSSATAGTYNCSDRSSNAAITIGQGNPVAIASQPLVVRRAGDVNGLTLQCFTSGNPAPAYLLWSFQRQLLTNTQSTTSPYTVSSLGQSLTPTMTGVYSCTVVTSAGNATADSIVEVYTPTVLYKTFSAAPLAYEGGNLTLTCVASQGSPPTFSWTLAGNPISSSGRFIIVGHNSSASQLTVVQLMPADAGVYQCTATVTPITQSDTFSMSIVVQYAPILRPLFSYNVTAIENSSAILSLTAMSVPSVTSVVWTKWGSPLPYNVSKYLTYFFNSSSGPLNNASLTILGVKVSDGGSYTCTVTNSFKATSLLFNLMIMTAPVLVPSPSGSQVLGIVNYPLIVTVQLLGANPAVSAGSATWTVGGSTLTSGGRTLLTYSSTEAVLNISSVLPGDDSANYTLTVTHPAGVRTHSFQLLAKAPPQPPTNIVVTVSACTFTLIWSPAAVSSSAVSAQGTVFQIRANDSAQWVDIGLPVPSADTRVVLDQPYVGGAGVVSGRPYVFRGVSLYQSIRGTPSIESAAIIANPQGTNPAVSTLIAEPSTSQSLSLSWTVVQHSCYSVMRYNISCSNTPVIVVADPVVTKREIVGLSPNSQYNCTVTVVYSNPVGVFFNSLTNWSYTYPAVPPSTVVSLPRVTQVPGAPIKVTISPPAGFVSSHCWIVVLPGPAPVESPDQLYPAGYVFDVYQSSSIKTRGTTSPYITAEIPLNSQGSFEFTVGDSSVSGGYLNGPLSVGSKYSIFVRYFPASSFVQNQYAVFVSTNFLTVQPESPATLTPGGAGVGAAGTGIIGGAVGGAIGLFVAVVILILLVCSVVYYRNRSGKDENDYVGEASLAAQSPGSFSYKAEDDSLLSPPPHYNTVPPQSSRPIPINQDLCTEKGTEKQLLSDDITDGPLLTPPTYRNLLEAEQMTPSCMKTSECVPAPEFEEYVAKRDAKKGLLFEKEFKNIQEISPRHQAEASGDPRNADKNRYSNIIAFDYTRVRLPPQVGVECSDYINANFIKGYPKSTNYIAAQGPLDQTVNDFWRMIWEHHVPTVVMLTNVLEEGKAKCSQYWPLGAGTETYGELKVKVEQSIILPDYTIRSLTVSAQGEEARSVLHFHYTNWHDYGTPTHLAPLINFIRVVNQSHLPQGPLLVHCSAGVGRTGTVIAIDYCMKQIHEEGQVDVKGVVSLLREQRNFMVQTQQQFICIHYVLLEAILCGDTSYIIGDFSKEYATLQLNNVATGMSLVEEEYMKLNSIKTVISKSSFISKVKPSTSTPALEYPAYFVKGYLNSQLFIVADGPCADTVEHFWHMLLENNCSSIVMLTPTDAGVDPYWPPHNQDMSYGNISVSVTEERAEHMYNVRTIMLKNRAGKTHLVTQYQFIGWTVQSLPDISGFVHFVLEVAKLVDDSSYTNNTILVHDTDSLGPSGIFCALWHCMERLRLEKVVDVFQAVQKLQLQKPGMVESVKQYAFIYDCVHECIEAMTAATATDV